MSDLKFHIIVVEGIEENVENFTKIIQYAAWVKALKFERRVQ